MKKRRNKGVVLLLSFFMMLQWICGVSNPVYALEWEEPVMHMEAENTKEWNDFQYVLAEGEITIVGYKSSVNGTLEIPSEIEGLPVTRVGNNAFCEQEQLTEVVIPNAVIEIGSVAFHNCHNLQTFIVDEDNSAYCVKNGLLLDKSERILIRCPSGRYGEVNDIPETVFLIADSAFEDCISLTGITLPQSVTSIGRLAFSYCMALNHIVLPEGLQKIGDAAFWNCIALQDVVFPSTLQSIGMMTFLNCQALSEVTVPSLSGQLPFGIFSDCSALQRVVIAEGVTTLGTEAFSGCTALQEIQLPSTLETIQEKAFQNCSSLQQIVIPASVSNLSACSFLGCTALSSVYVAEENPYYTVLDGVLLRSNLEELVFCPPALPLTDYRIPESVIVIDNYAFQNNLQIQSIIIPETVQELQPAFCYNADNLKVVQFETSADIPEYAFQSCDQLADVALQNGVSTVETGAFLDCVSLCSVKIPETVTTIGAYAFGYHTDAENNNTALQDFSIFCYAGTIAEQYAEENGFSIHIISPITTTTTTAKTTMATSTIDTTMPGTTATETTMTSNTTTVSDVNTTTTTTTTIKTTMTTSTTTDTTMLGTTATETTITSNTTTVSGVATTTTVKTTMTISTTDTTLPGTTAMETTMTSNTTAATTKVTTTTTDTTAITTMTTVTTEFVDTSSGDVDGDGIVSVEDAIIVLTYYARRAANLPAYLYSEEDAAAEQDAFCRADVDENGQILVEDAIWILEQYARRSAGLL